MSRCEKIILSYFFKKGLIFSQLAVLKSLRTEPVQKQGVVELGKVSPQAAAGA